MTIGEQIRNARKIANMTQKALGDALGVSSQMIAQYEKGDRIPKIGTLSKIAQALNVSIGDLDSEYTSMMGDLNNASNLETQLKQFLENIPNMNASEESKQENITKASVLLRKTQELIGMIDSGMSQDREKKQILDECRTLKNGIKEAEDDIDNIFLTVLHNLNIKGQEKVILYATDLIQIPEYRKDDESDKEKYNPNKNTISSTSQESISANNNSENSIFVDIPEDPEELEKMYPPVEISDITKNIG